MTAPLTVRDLQDRVDRGVAWLDKHLPDWWRTDRPNRGEDGGPIDVDALAMARPCHCVLGQLLGSYYRADITLEDGVAMGFDAASAYREDGQSEEEWQAALNEEFDALAALWTRVIEQRRAGVDRP